MDVLLGIILPVFGIMATGYGATFTPFFDDAARRGLAQFVFYFAIPIMLFYKLATAELPDALEPGYLIAFYASAGLTFVFGLPLFRLITGEPLRELVLCGFGSIYGNVVLVGIPVVLAAMGDSGAVPLFLLISFHTSVQYTFITVLIEGWSRGDSNWRSLPIRVGKSLATNPILLSIVAGALFNRSGLLLPDLVERWANLFGQAGIPCALFSLGASLSGYRIDGRVTLVLAMTATKLLVMPMLFWLLATMLFDVPPIYLAVGMLLAAMPAGVNTYLFAVRYGQSEAEVAATVLLSTLLAIPVLAAIVAIWVPL